MLWKGLTKTPEKIRKTAEKHRGMKRSEHSRTKMSEKRKQILNERGGALNKGHKMFFNPEDPTQRIQCLPEKAPIGWIKGNPKAQGKHPYLSTVSGEIKWFDKSMIVDEEWIVWNPNKKELRCLQKI